MVLIFLLGFAFEWVGICLIVRPVFAPILAHCDSDRIGDKLPGLLVWHTRGRQPADLVHDAAVRRLMLCIYYPGSMLWLPSVAGLLDGQWAVEAPTRGRV
jgi:hypothetical protein